MFSAAAVITRNIAPQRCKHIRGKIASSPIAGIHSYLEPLQRSVIVVCAIHPVLDDVAQMLCIYWHEVNLHSKVICAIASGRMHYRVREHKVLSRMSLS